MGELRAAFVPTRGAPRTSRAFVHLQRWLHTARNYTDLALLIDAAAAPPTQISNGLWRVGGSMEGEKAAQGASFVGVLPTLGGFCTASRVLRRRKEDGRAGLSWDLLPQACIDSVDRRNLYLRAHHVSGAHAIMLDTLLRAVVAIPCCALAVVVAIGDVAVVAAVVAVTAAASSAVGVAAANNSCSQESSDACQLNCPFASHRRPSKIHAGTPTNRGGRGQFHPSPTLPTCLALST